MRWIIVMTLALAGCSSGGPSGSNVEWRMDTNRLKAPAGKSVSHSATCPSGKVAVSGGHSIEKNPGPMTVVSSLPMGDKWSVTVRNDSPEPKTLEIVAYVGCISR
jgi:hypothetical protein